MIIIEAKIINDSTGHVEGHILRHINNWDGYEIQQGFKELSKVVIDLVDPLYES